MSTRNLILMLLLSAGLTAACQNSPYAVDQPSTGQHIDGLSRNVTQTQGGSIRDPASLSPPPVQPAYVEDR